MKHIFLMQHKDKINGHILIDKNGEIKINDNEFDILNFIFSNQLQNFEPLIIEYELDDQEEVNVLTNNVIVEKIKYYIGKYNLNPFIDIARMCDILGSNDYYGNNDNKFKELKMQLINKDLFLLNTNNDNYIESDIISDIAHEVLEDGVITNDEIEKIKSKILNEMNINKISDKEIANKLIKESIDNGLLKKDHDSDEVVTLGTLLAILNRLNK